jgi:hypothetical protein
MQDDEVMKKNKGVWSESKWLTLQSKIEQERAKIETERKQRSNDVFLIRWVFKMLKIELQRFERIIRNRERKLEEYIERSDWPPSAILVFIHLLNDAKDKVFKEEAAIIAQHNLKQKAEEFMASLNATKFYSDSRQWKRAVLHRNSWLQQFFDDPQPWFMTKVPLYE